MMSPISWKYDLTDEVDRDITLAPLRGSRALVYGGTHRPSTEKVAIKVFRFGPPTNQKALKRIRREVALWKSLRHKNVLPLLGMTTQFDYTISLVSEWAGKGNAHDYVQNRIVDPRPLFMDIASGLNYLHDHRIIHGDLRGHNIMISKDGQAMITDYGVSSLVDAEFDQNAAISTPGGRSIRWMAPETMENYGEVGIRGDIWTFGMTILELFTRQVPFHYIPGLRAVIGQIMNGQPDRPSGPATCFRMTDAWWDICCRCWMRDPWQRPSIRDMIRIIERI
ncbi:kinase-like domain-containing protein [Pisolithus marmoratus]|nr:kinase-like domain-containing protein [Pisolithus marmoratus]KAI6042403.1 kinase-like domain-containing protein [Pisolithus marmoratus]